VNTKKKASSQGGGGSRQPLHPPPRSAPGFEFSSHVLNFMVIGQHTIIDLSESNQSVHGFPSLTVRCLLPLCIIFVSASNLRSQASRSPYTGTVAWDLQSSKHSPIKTVGMATSVPSSQTSPALVNALFERVEEQAEVSAHI